MSHRLDREVTVLSQILRISVLAMEAKKKKSLSVKKAAHIDQTTKSRAFVQSAQDLLPNLK